MSGDKEYWRERALRAERRLEEAREAWLQRSWDHGISSLTLDNESAMRLERALAEPEEKSGG